MAGPSLGRAGRVENREGEELFQHSHLGGGSSHIFYIHPENWANGIQFDDHIFLDGLVQPPISHHLGNLNLGIFWDQFARLGDFAEVIGTECRISGSLECCHV